MYGWDSYVPNLKVIVDCMVALLYFSEGRWPYNFITGKSLIK